MPSLLAYVDLQRSILCSNAGGTGLTLPAITGGDDLSISFRFLTGNGSGGVVLDQKFPSLVASMRMGLGLLSAPPTSGSYRLTLSGTPTAPIPCNATPAQIAAALNAVSGSPGDFTAEADGVSLLISRTGGQRVSLGSGVSHLSPTTYLNVEERDSDGLYSYRLSFLPVPLAYTENSYAVLPAPPEITILQHGGTDSSGLETWPTIMDLHVPPTFQGTYQLVWGTAKTALLAITSPASDVQAALNALMSPAGGQSVTVNNYQNYHVTIAFDGKAFQGRDISPLGINVFSAPPADWTLLMETGTDSLLALLQNKGKLTLQLEASAEIYTSEPVSGEAPPPTIPIKLFSVPVTVNPPLLFPSFNEERVIDWLIPRSTSYVPFHADQVITGQQNYTTVIGDGSSTSFTIVHNLGTENLASLMVRQNTDPGLVLTSGQGYSISVIDANSVRVSFPSAPSASSMVVSIMACGPASAFQAHTHSIGQVTGLSDLLSSLSGRLFSLESLIRTSVTTLAPTSGTPDQKNFLPSFGELLPDLSVEESVVSIASQVVVPTSSPTAAPAVVPGTDLQQQVQAAQAQLSQINAQIAAAKAAADTSAQASAQKGGAIMVIPFTSSMGIQSWEGPLPVAGAAGFDPADFTQLPPLLSSQPSEHPLWWIPVHSAMFGTGRTMQIDWGLWIQSILSNTPLTYTLLVEAGSISGGAITWNTSTPLQSVAIPVAEVPTVHSFGITLKAAASGILLTRQAYGVQETTGITLSGDFAVRCRLAALTPDSAVASPRAWIASQIVPSLTASQPTLPGGSPAAIAQASIY